LILRWAALWPHLAGAQIAFVGGPWALRHGHGCSLSWLRGNVAGAFRLAACPAVNKLASGSMREFRENMGLSQR